ncbi:guanine nucleotide exchange factor DBS-like isoform X5 [Antedon mediterranea]|uniref:guanine nucleotide exchange factor DBS-like isoform X5 n=1 Tax=Antedon mediterranea TaxID=105859 RepID=UPI003AF63B61
MNIIFWIIMVPVFLFQDILSRTLALASFLFQWNTLQEISSYSKRINDDHLKKLMEMEVSIKHVAQIMQDGVGYLSGGRTSAGLPIITLPDTEKFTALSDDGFVQLMMYLTRVPSFLRNYEESMIEADRGFAIIADRRNESWSSVKTLLYRISGLFPGSMQCIYIIKPCGWFARKFSDFGYSLVKDDFNFKTVLLDTVEELHSHIDPSQLTTDFKGTIRFNLQLWIEDRMAIERFAANCNETSKIVQAISDEMNQHELPNDLDAAKLMLHDHTVKHNEMKEDILSTRRHGETLLGCIRKPSKDTASFKLNPDKLSNVCAVESAGDIQNKLLVQLEETEKSFDVFWDGHKIKLMQCVDYRRFDYQFKQVKLVLDNYLYKINDANELGDSVASVERLSTLHNEFEGNTHPAFESAEKLRSEGIELITQENYAGDCIRPKCEDISELIEEIERKTLTRTIVLSKSLELHQRIHKAQQWCSKGMEVLASQDIDTCQTKEGVDQGLKNIDAYLENCKELKLSNPKEFHTMFSDILNSELSSKQAQREHAEALVTEVVTKMEDVKNMFEKRRESLKKIAAKLERQQPVVMVAPQTTLQMRKPNQITNKLSPLSQRRSEPVSPLREKKKVLPRTPRPAKKDIEVLRDSEESTADLCGQEGDSLNSKRGHVMNELIETERLYVTELQAVITGYIDQMHNPTLTHLIPPALVEKTQVLFANWEQLYQFHKNTFLVDLENCKSTPALVGRCFVEREHEINKLYSIYCQNKPQAEVLRRECGNDNPFFVECQKQLGHRLPLSAYLLKPVQRITKYQLLLKEMLKYSAAETGVSDLQKALDCMLHVLKFVNDSMHQIAITGFDGRLSDLGKLLMQGSFYVWVEHKKGNIKDIRFKKMQRHMFLYEKCILFCKKRDDLKDKICYTYKNKLRVQDLGITEHVKGDRRKFELWLQDKSEIHIIQAVNDETKVTWVKEIRELLHSQLEEELAMKDLIEQKTHEIFDNNRINNNLGHDTTVLPSPTPSETSSASGNFVNMSLADNDEDGWASEEFSDSDDGMDDTCSVNTQVIAMNQYVVLAEYETVEETELPVKEGDIVEVERVGKSGWWLVRKNLTNEKGWVPAGYLESLAMRATRTSVSYVPQESSRRSHRPTVHLRRNRSRSGSRKSLQKRNAIRVESRA